MSSPTDSQNQAANSPSQDPNHNQQEDPPQSNDPQSPKTLTLEIPDLEHPNLHADELKQDDPEDITPISPTISDTHFNSTSVVANFTASRRGGGGSKRSKRHHHQEKKIQKRLEILVGTFNPVPFVPVKTLDFASHEALLRRLGLWDFVHLHFDINIRTDLIIQLIANFNPTGRHSYVNGCRIKVSRADLARALSLPAKKDKVDSAVEVESEESIGFIEDFVSTWLLLHEDTWMMTDDILSVTKAIKEGHFEKVDWAKLIWLMLEKELAAAPKLGNCYYASHLQKLIKHQKSDLFKEEPVKMEVDVNDDSEEEDVRMSEEVRGGSELEEHNIELSLGGLDNSAKDDGGKEGKEQVGDEDTMDFEESKEDEEQRQWVKSSVEGHFLRQCNLGEVAGVECEERKQEEEAGEEEEKEGEDGGGGGEEDDDDDEEEEEEEEGEEEVGFSISPKGDTYSENFIAAMEAAQIPFSSGVQIRDNVSSGDFLASRVETQTIPGSSALFSNGNGNKREIEHLDNDIPHHALNGGNKRMRSDGPWDMKSSSDFEIYMEQMEHIMGKARMAYEAKEQAYHDMSMNQQVLLSELQRRDNVIQHLHKTRIEEQQKGHSEVYRLERELYMMGNLLEGYRKALKETHKAFAEYRAKCPLPEEPIYKDTGSGGLVLSTMELEKRRLKQEEEERQSRLLIEKKVKEFEVECITKFEAYKDGVELLVSKLMEVEKEVNVLKEIFAKRKLAKMSECPPAEE
ncbi:hypothetical protein P3X46_018917 [Hevea brasiliensis]|uniref:Uncharacterized protein n=1 Tax=Hevea brasiliensis TaxID=3981 RepID=A0ABQ9LS73_HEVBR|nr:uncharacterized protein LOC110653772 [Hevea brasiliensis]KAJ9170852.1 hypothetical protein P3X46_018917 [Hevea brasiliensis]